MQAKGVQLAPLESSVSCLLEATPECGAMERNGGMCPPGDQPCAEQHRAEAEGGGLYHGTLSPSIMSNWQRGLPSVIVSEGKEWHDLCPC